MTQRETPDNSVEAPPTFQSRLGGPLRAAPYNPKSFYLLAFFGGAVALALIAWRNLDRLPSSSEIRQRTGWVLGGLGAVAILALILCPAEWWTPMRNIRMMVRAVAVVAALGLERIQRGPAFAAAARHNDFTSMWSAKWPILGAAVAQGAVTFVVGLARGVV